jgi:hypothetical protein
MEGQVLRRRMYPCRRQQEGRVGPVTGTCTRPCDEGAPLEGPLCGSL